MYTLDLCNKCFCALRLPFLQYRLREGRGYGFPLKILVSQGWCWEHNEPWGFRMCDISTGHVDLQTLITCLSETNSSTGDNNSPTMGLGLITRIPYFLLWDETNF